MVLKALAKDPAQRYGDADSFIKDLEVVEARLRQGPVDVESTAVFAPDGGHHGADRARAAAGRAAEPAPAAGGAGRLRLRRRSASRPRGRRTTAAAGGSRLALLGGTGCRSRCWRSCCSASADKVTVPPVVGQTLDSARSGSIAPASTSRSSAAPTRRRATSCSSSRPIRARRSTKGSVVTLFVSNGPSTVKVPDVVGQERGGRAPASAARGPAAGCRARELDEGARRAS